ncbi:hypothetical protein ACFVZC_28375 [Streptomyces marokkonensis]|uniref:Uncharacterized protein n=1 Tax=Streptomyces marokkonensis TaxID=324855 RepID=A0ABW6QDY4_9ACTN
MSVFLGGHDLSRYAPGQVEVRRSGASARRRASLRLLAELLTFESGSIATFYRTVFGHEEEPVVSAGLGCVTRRRDRRPVAGRWRIRKERGSRCCDGGTDGQGPPHDREAR